MGMTPQHFHTIPTSCAICQLCTLQNSLHALTLFIHIEWTRFSTQLCSLHSLTHKRRPMSAMVSSNKTSQHNLNSNIYHTDPLLLMHFLHTVKTDHVCHAQYSNYIAATHNITHSPCTSKHTTHPPLSTPLHITPFSFNFGFWKKKNPCSLVIFKWLVGPEIGKRLCVASCKYSHMCCCMPSTTLLYKQTQSIFV